MSSGHYSTYTVTDQIVLRSKGTYSYLLLILFGSVYYSFTPKNWLNFTRALGMLCLLNTLLILYQTAVGVIACQRGGFFNNASMSGCFIAATIPFLATLNFNKQYLFSFISLATFGIFLTDSSMSVGVLAVVAITYVWRSARYRWWGVGGAFTLLFGGLFFQGAKFLSPTGRDSIIMMGWVYFKELSYQLTGAGPGTSVVFIPYLQSIHNQAFFRRNVFVWFHSDWFQILFEQGWVGLVLYVLAYVAALKKAYDNPPIFSAVAAVGAWSLGNYPFHWPVHALICVGIMLLPFTLRELCQKDHVKN